MPLEITIDNPEHIAPSAESDGERSVAGAQNSPQYTSSVSETSETRDGYVHVDLPYPSEIPDDIHPSDSASESQRRPPRRHTAGSSRAHTGPRTQARRQDRESLGYILRHPAPESPESVDSADDFVAGPQYRPDPRQRQSHHGSGHVVQRPLYAHSSSSGASYVYPAVPGPPSNQMVHFGAPPPVPYGQPYPQMGVPPSVGYPPAQSYQMSHHSGSHVSSPYGVPPFAGQQIVPLGSAPGYFPPQYPAPYPPAQPWDPYQRLHQSPPPQPPAAPAPRQSASPVQSPAPNTVDQEEIVKRVEAILLEEKKEREARDAAREAAMKAAADDASAKAERAASDAKIAEEAAAKAREEVKKEAEAKAASDAAKAQAEAEAKAERAASDAKIAEEAAAKAKKEMEEAAAAAVPPPPEKKAPIKFKDAIGRKFNFPFHLCTKWSGMEELIRQAFLHVENIGPHVQDGHYDLLGPNGEIILPQVWDTVVEPDWTITMHMWPMPEKAKTPPLDGGVLNVGDLVNLGKKHKGKGAKKLTPPPPPFVLPSINALNVTPPLDAPTPGGKEIDKAPKKAGSAKTGPKKVVPATGLSAWIVGGKSSKPPPKALKETKKPEGAAASQHGAPASESSCIVL